MIDRELVMDLRAEIKKIAREEVKKAVEEQTEQKQDESVPCVNDEKLKSREIDAKYRLEDIWLQRVLEKVIKGMALLPVDATPCALCKYDPTGSEDGNPCGMCPADRKSDDGFLRKLG